MNSVNVIGNLVADPEFRQTPNGKDVCDFRIAINEGYGENKRAVFISVSCWQKLAEIVNKYCVKGTKVGVSGSLRQDNWESKDGEKRSAILINARDVLFISGTKDQASEGGSSNEDSSGGGEENLPF